MIERHTVKHLGDNPTLFNLLRAGVGISFPIDVDCAWWLERKGEKIRLTGWGVDLTFDSFSKAELAVAMDYIRYHVADVAGGPGEVAFEVVPQEVTE